jgi:hypothetical protein
LETVPENTSGVLDDAYIGRHDGLVVLNQRNVLALPCFIEEASEIVESSKTPVALVGRESVGSDCIQFSITPTQEDAQKAINHK